MTTRTVLIALLQYLVFPLWLAAGVADYWCHRRTAIAQTSGFRESVLHVVQAVQIGIPLLAGLLLEINALVLLVMIVAFVVHTATAYWDVSYTAPRRYISPFEQHVHGLMEMLPLIALVIVSALHPGQFAALFGSGTEPASFALAWKAAPLSPETLAWVLGPVLILQAVPLAEEFWRTWRVRRLRTSGHDILAGGGP